MYTKFGRVTGRVNQSFSNSNAIYSDILLLIREIFANLVTVSIQVRVRNSIACAATDIFHGPMKSTANSDYGNKNAFLRLMSTITSTR